MSRVLIISGHPNLAQSTANTLIIQEVQKQLADVEVRRLDELYPDYQIDVSAEQDALSRADVIVWQFPFYWYSTPALFKKWIDDVHTHGFAYGSTGNKLHGKKLIVSFTTGGSADDYSETGHEGMALSAFFHNLAKPPICAVWIFCSPTGTRRHGAPAGFSNRAAACGIFAHALRYAGGGQAGGFGGLARRQPAQHSRRVRSKLDNSGAPSKQIRLSENGLLMFSDSLL